MNRSTSVALCILIALLTACTSYDNSGGTEDATTPAGNATTRDAGKTSPGVTTRQPESAKAVETSDGKAAPPDATATDDVDGLVARLRRDQERQAQAQVDDRPLVPSGTEMETQLTAMSRNFLDKLVTGNVEAAKPCFLSDEEVTRLFSPAYSKLLASTRGSLNVKEWEEFQLAVAGGQKVEFVGSETVRPAIADPSERGLYRESVLFIDTIAIDFTVGGIAKKIQLRHLVQLDGAWKFLQFEVK